MQDNLANRGNLIELDLSSSEINYALRELGSHRSRKGEEKVRTVAGNDELGAGEADRVESNASIVVGGVEDNHMVFTVESLTELRQLPNFFTKQTFVTSAPKEQAAHVNSSGEVDKQAHSTESKEYLARIPSLTSVQSLTGSEQTEAEIGPKNSDYAYLNSQMEPKQFTSNLSDETINKRILSTESCEDMFKLVSLPVQTAGSSESLSSVYEFIAATPSNSDYAYLDANNQLKSTFIQ